MLKKLNYLAASLLPSKIYWYWAGLIHPWQAVLEDASMPEEVYNRGVEFVAILTTLKLINKNSRLLDIGCGVGRMEYALCRKVQSCTGVDISASMVRLAKRYVNQNNVCFAVTNGKDLKVFKNNNFNLVISILVFQHVPRKIFTNYLKESFRVLDYKGKLFFQIPTDESGVQKDPAKNHPWALRYYQTEKLQKTLGKIGFKRINFFNTKGLKFKKQDNQALVLAVK